MGAAVPSISLSGWITAVPEKVDLMLSHFFESDAIQTYLYKGNVANVQNILQQYGDNIPALCIQLRATMERYFAAYFDAVVVDVSANNDPTVNPSNAITLTVMATINDNGTEYSLGTVVAQNGATFKRVMGLINNGIVPITTGGVA